MDASILTVRDSIEEQMVLPLLFADPMRLSHSLTQSLSAPINVNNDEQREEHAR